MGSIFAVVVFLSKKWKWSKNLDKASKQSLCRIICKKENTPREQTHQDLFKSFWIWQTSRSCSPNPAHLLKSYYDNAKVGVERKSATSRKEPPATKKILRKEPALETKKSQPEKEQLQEIPLDPEHLPLSPFSSSRVEVCWCFSVI